MSTGSPSTGRVPAWTVVVAVLVGVLVLGGAGLLVARAMGPVSPSARQAADPASTPSVTPSGGSASPPTAEPTISPLPSAPPPSVEPLTPSPVDPATAAPPDATTSTGVPTDQPTGQVPTSALPSGSASATPSLPAGGDTLDLGRGLTMVVPAGWEVHDGPDNGRVVIGTDGAVMFAGAVDGFQGSTASEVALKYAQEVLTDSVDGLKVGSPQPRAVDAPNVVSATLVEYEGRIVGQQGSTDVTGSVSVFLRQDGTALVVDVTQQPDVDVTDDVALVVSSLLQSF